MKVKQKNNTDVQQSDLEVLNQQFQPIILRAEAAVDQASDADRKLNEVLAEIYNFGQSLIKDERLTREFLEAHGQKYGGWAQKNIYQPLMKIVFAGRKVSGGLLSQRSEALDIMTREKPANVSADVWLDQNGGFKGVYDKFKGPSAIDVLRKKNGGQITQNIKPPLFDLHRAVKALFDFTLPMQKVLDKKVGSIPTRAFLIRNYNDNCRIDMVAVGHAFPCGHALLAHPIPGLGNGAFLLSDSQAARFVHAYPKELGWTAAAAPTEATFTSPKGVVIKAEEISLVPHRDLLRACAQMRNHSAQLTLDATGIASFRNWQRVIDLEYQRRKHDMQISLDRKDVFKQWKEWEEGSALFPVYTVKAPHPVPALPAFLDLESNGGMTVGFQKASMPFASPTFFLVSDMFGGGKVPILPERQLAVADVGRLCDVIGGLQVQAIATFADTDMDKAALCVDALMDDDALRLVMPTIISVAGNYASACDCLLRVASTGLVIPAQPQ